MIIIIITIWRRKGEDWKTRAKKKLGLNLEANSQLTAKLEKPEWIPGSWKNHPPPLSSPSFRRLLDSAVQHQFPYCWSTSPPNSTLVPHLLAETSKDTLTKWGHDSVTPHYFAVSAEGRGTLNKWIKGKGFQGECADIFELPHRILKASISSSAFKELKWLAIPNAAPPHFNCITAPGEAKKNTVSLPTNIVTLFWPPLSSPVTLPREEVVAGCQNKLTAKAFKSPTCA